MNENGPRVPSPCNSVCRIEPASGWCEGCWRSIDEIIGWGSMDDAARRAVWAALDERRMQTLRDAADRPNPGNSAA